MHHLPSSITLHLILALLLCAVILASDKSGWECGRSEEFPAEISRGDEVLSSTMYPWMAAFFRDDVPCQCSVTVEERFCFCCTASVVGAKHLLLAAHCLAKAGTDKVLSGEEALAHVRVRLGSHDYSSPDAIGPNISRVLAHEEYNASNFHNDIALIELAQPLNFSNKIRPICLPKRYNENQQMARSRSLGLSGLSATIAGWGHQHEAVYDDQSRELPEEQPPDRAPQLLREGHATLISVEECIELLGKWKHTANITKQHHICMAIGRQNAERGDSGGPLFLNMARTGQAARFVEIGVTSFGAPHNSTEERHPVIYTRVSAYCDWISKMTAASVKCIRKA